MEKLVKNIKFSFNWNNKLSCNAFTTIRLHNPKQYIEGLFYRVFLADKKSPGGWKEIGVFQCKRIVTRRQSKLGTYISYLDTGYSEEETIKILNRMYGKLHASIGTDPLLDVLLLVKTELPNAKKTAARAAEPAVL